MKDSISIMGAIKQPEYTDEEQHWFHGVINKRLMERIESVMEAVVRLDAYKLLAFDCSVESYYSMPVETGSVDIFKNEYSEYWGHTRVKPLSENQPMTQRESMLVVTQDGIYWAWGTEDGADESNTYSTQLITIKELREAFQK